MKIAVLDDYQDAFRKVTSFGRLKDHEVAVFHDTEKDPLRLAQRLKDADVVLLTQQRSSFPRAVIEKLPNLKLIVQTGSHRDHIDWAACAEKNITVVGTRVGGTLNSTAELTWALILASVRHIPQEVQLLKQGVWQSKMLGTELYGRTLGIYALGKIGTMVAQVGKAFGMKVLCWGRAASLERACEAGYQAAASREAFFAGADIVSLHIHYLEETRGIVTAADLARMKPTALLVNTSRAGLVQDGALLQALEKGRPGFAAVDVYEDEPVVGGSHPLLGMPNVICTPHLGYAVREKYEEFYRNAIEGMLAFASGKPINVLDVKAVAAR
jgi:D-3-phosphoglycerate dehydrogenase